jgi:hypothetical protein
MQELRTTGWDITLDRKALLMRDMSTAMTLDAAGVSACDTESFLKIMNAAVRGQKHS